MWTEAQKDYDYMSKGISYKTVVRPAMVVRIRMLDSREEDRTEDETKEDKIKNEHK